MNKVMLIGNLTADPQTSTFDSGRSVCRFTIAINRFSRSENNAVDYINIVAWEQLGANCQKFLSKGSKVAVLGRIQTGSYEKDGVKRYTTDVVAENVEFLNRAGQGGQQEVRRDSVDNLQEVTDNITDDIPF